MEKLPGDTKETKQPADANSVSRDLAEVQKVAEKRKKRLSQPFAQGVCKRLFAILLVIAVGFSLIELKRYGDPIYSTTAFSSFLSLLIATAVPGVPLAIISFLRLRALKGGASDESPLKYKVYFGTSVGFLALWLLGLLGARIFGA